MNVVALEMPIGDRAKYIGIIMGIGAPRSCARSLADIAILTELKPW